MRALSFLLALPLLANLVAASDVVDLTAGSFASEVNGEKLALVEFFAPWCGHCKNLAPHYEEAATELKNKHGIKLAKVDCTAETDLCQEHGVRGYPTLKVFRSGSSSDYTGTRKADGIISYMVKQSLPAISEVTADDHEEFTKKDKVVLIAYAKSEKDIPKAFKSTAESLRDTYLFGSTTDLSLSPTGNPTIVLYKSFDEGQNVLEDKLSSLSDTRLQEWIKENSIPLFDQVSPENFATYAESGLPLAYLFSIPNDPQLPKLLESLKPIAREAKGRINFVWIDAIKFAEHGKTLNVVAESFPSLVIQDMSNKGRKYVLPQRESELNADNVQDFVRDFEDGKLEPSLKSQPVPENQDESVYQLVTEEWDKIVLDDEKDVLVEFYASWCGHCQRLAPIYDSLGEHFAEFKDVLTIAKMEAPENDLPLSAPFEIAGFPTIKFKRAGTREFIDYNGDRSLESLIDFVLENANNPIEAANETDVEMGEVEDDDGAAGEDFGHDEL